MTNTIPLIHPIYLDVPMLVSFAAALEGGVSYQSEVTTGETTERSGSVELGGKLGISKLFSTLFDASATADIEGDASQETSATQKESRAHTEASIAILLYERLCRDGSQLQRPNTLDEFKSVEPGALVEVAGSVEKNAVDSIIDYAEAVVILAEFKKNQKKPNPLSDMHNLKNALEKDRKRTPISNILLRCSQPPGMGNVLGFLQKKRRELSS